MKGIIKMRNIFKIIFSIFLLSAISFSQQMNVHTSSGADIYNLADIDSITFTIPTGTVTDIDGNVYQTIKIGDQWWMAENLKVTKYRNGDAIPNVTDSTEWSSLSTAAYCVYNNDNGNMATYGLLYNWYAVGDSRNIAPAGWHVPTDAELRQLEMHLGMSQSQADSGGWRGTDEGGKLKETGTTHWNSPNTGATNESGFTALPGGYRDDDNGPFGGIGSHGALWSSTASGGDEAYYRTLYYDYSNVRRGHNHRRNGFSVRCVRD